MNAVTGSDRVARAAIFAVTTQRCLDDNRWPEPEGPTSIVTSRGISPSVGGVDSCVGGPLPRVELSVLVASDPGDEGADMPPWPAPDRSGSVRVAHRVGPVRNRFQRHGACKVYRQGRPELGDAQLVRRSKRNSPVLNAAKHLSESASTGRCPRSRRHGAVRPVQASRA